MSEDECFLRFRPLHRDWEQLFEGFIINPSHVEIDTKAKGVRG